MAHTTVHLLMVERVVVCPHNCNQHFSSFSSLAERERKTTSPGMCWACRLDWIYGSRSQQENVFPLGCKDPLGKEEPVCARSTIFFAEIIGLLLVLGNDFDNPLTSKVNIPSN